MKVTCLKCGSDKLAHCARYTVRTPITDWSSDDKTPSAFDTENEKVIGDSCESLEYPYDCMECGAFEMTEIDLLYDGEHHPDYWDGEETDAVT